jgi:hypothetical protein
MVVGPYFPKLIPSEVAVFMKMLSAGTVRSLLMASVSGMN